MQADRRSADLPARWAALCARLRRPLAAGMALWLLATLAAASAAPRLHPLAPSQAPGAGYVLLCTPTGVKLVATGAAVADEPRAAAGAQQPAAGLSATTGAAPAHALDCPGCLQACLGLGPAPSTSGWQPAASPAASPPPQAAAAPHAAPPAHARPPARAPPAAA
jgi:hypothetical protein